MGLQLHVSALTRDLKLTLVPALIDAALCVLPYVVGFRI